jgi:hypothetical protein
LKKGNEMNNKPILCLDFDGVLHTYLSGWKDVSVVSDPSVPGAMRFISEAQKHFRVAIYSSRSAYPEGVKAMRDSLLGWLQDEFCEEDAEKIFVDILWPINKPPAFITIDDRVITFKGLFPNPEDLLGFKPWNKL